MIGEGRDTVLVVAAHPDDEVLGCGATLARHAAQGDHVHVVFLADGETSRETLEAEAVDRRRAQSFRSAEALDIAEPHFLGLPDNRLDSQDLLDVIKCLEAVVREIEPTILYVHHAGDLNIDHQIAHRAAMTACRPLPGSRVRLVLAFEVPSSTEWSTLGISFVPTVFIDATPFFAKKLAAMACYGSELRPFPHPRSVEGLEALAKVRGTASGLPLAEAFMHVRQRVE